MVNTVGKMFSEVNRAYAAGLIDADGAIMASIEQHQELKLLFRVRVIVKLTQKKRNILDWLKDQTTLGRVVQNRQAYDWLIRSQHEVAVMLAYLQPYSRIKSRQIVLAQQILALDSTSQQSLLQKATLADSLASFNVRSRNRRLNYVSKIQEYISRND